VKMGEDRSNAGSGLEGELIRGLPCGFSSCSLWMQWEGELEKLGPSEVALPSGVAGWAVVRCARVT